MWSSQAPERTRPSLKRFAWPSWKRTFEAARRRVVLLVPSGQRASTSACFAESPLRLPRASAFSASRM
jgi:hypothetical protein